MSKRKNKEQSLRRKVNRGRAKISYDKVLKKIQILIRTSRGKWVLLRNSI